MNNSDLGRFIATLRKEKGMTQLQLAGRLNVTDKAVSRWETGRNYPDIETLERLSAVLDVSISELLEGKRIEQDNLFSVSEEHIVKEIKKSRKNGRKYKIIICSVIIIAVISALLAMKNNGVFDGVIYNKIECYSNDIITIINNLDGYIATRPEADGTFIADNGFVFINHDKTTNDIFYLSGTSENGRAFYANTMYEENNTDNYTFVGEFRKNKERATGIALSDLKHIIAQLDLSSLPEHEKYELSIESIYTYNNHNLETNSHQKEIIKYIFKNSTLQKYNEKYISGNLLLITVAGYDNGSGGIIAYIFYSTEKQQNN